MEKIFKVTVGNVTKEYPKGTTFGDIAKEYQKDYELQWSCAGHEI